MFFLLAWRAVSILTRESLSRSSTSGTDRRPDSGAALELAQPRAAAVTPSVFRQFVLIALVTSATLRVY